MPEPAKAGAIIARAMPSKAANRKDRARMGSGSIHLFYPAGGAAATGGRRRLQPRRSLSPTALR